MAYLYRCACTYSMPLLNVYNTIKLLAPCASFNLLPYDLKAYTHMDVYS